MGLAPALYGALRESLRGPVAVEVVARLAAAGGARPVTAALAVHAGVPGAEAEARREVRRTTAANLDLLAGLERPLRSLERAGVRWAAVKGLDHLVRLYPGLEWRSMLDADLLVHPEDLARSREVLVEAGFMPASGTPAVQPGLCFSDGRVSVDLHRRITRRGGFDEDVAWLLRGTGSSAFEGCPVRMMAAPQALAAASLFLAKDGFFSAMVRAERVAELGLLADAAEPGGEHEAWAGLAACGAGRVARRARSLVEWVRGGARPAWTDPGFGGAAAGSGSPPALLRRLLRGARLQDSARDTAGWLRAQIGSFVLQRLSGRRLGAWRTG